jgi:protein-S-isoprenylcysteine O-methyltransferase Ste14
MNLEYPSIGLNLNQWQILLDLENVCYFLLDNEEDQEIINWLKNQTDWDVDDLSIAVTLFHRKPQDGVPPEELIKNAQTAHSINPPVFLLMALLLMLILNWIVPTANLLFPPWNLLGIPLIGLGIMFNLLADRQFHNHQTTVKPGELSSWLIQDGVFKYSRNPMYTGMVLVLLGFASILGSWASFLVVPVFVIFLYYRFISLEEHMLEEQFGEEWREYQQDIPRWF